MKHIASTTVAVLGFASFMASIVAAPALAREPYQLPLRLSDDNHMIVDVLVNDQGPYTFVVDTAAGMTVVFESLVVSASLPTAANGRVVQVQGASGIIDAPFVEVGALTMGDWTVELDQAIALPNVQALTEDVAGILGNDLLMDQPVGFHLSDGLLHIYEQGVAINPEQDLTGRWFDVSYETRYGHDQFLWTEVTVNGVVIQALVDTGARRTVINSAGVEALGLDPRDSSLVDDEPIRGGTNNSTPAWVQPVSTVQFGERAWGARNLTLSDPSVLNALGVAEEPMIIFGSDFMAEQNFIIDPMNKVIWMQGRRSAAFGGYGTTASTVENSSPLN